MVVVALRAAAGESIPESGTGRRTWSVEGGETLSALGQLHLESLAKTCRKRNWMGDRERVQLCHHPDSSNDGGCLGTAAVYTLASWRDLLRIIHMAMYYYARSYISPFNYLWYLVS